MFDVLIIPLCLILFGYLAFKRWSALLIGPLVTIILIVLARMPMFDTMLGPYMESAGNYFKNFFLVFFVGALFGAVYKETKGAQSIAMAIIKVTKGKFAAPVIMIITGILTYGGISGFVVFFAMFPIALEVFRESNVSRRIMPAAISSGCWTWSMSGPGSPAIQNVIPMRYLGTGPLASLVPGFAAAAAQLIMIFIWLEWRTRRLRAKGEGFVEPENSNYDPNAVTDLPHPAIAIIPPVLILVLFNIFEVPVEGAVIIGTLVAMALLWRYGKNFANWIEILNKGAVDSTMAILNTALVVGFAGAVAITPGFQSIINNLQNLRMPPLVFVAVTVAIAAGAAGSASGGIGVAFEALKGTYAAMGINFEHVHRIAAIASGTLDSLPHQGAQITLLQICGMSHRESYMDIAVTQILVPTLALFVAIPLMALGL